MIFRTREILRERGMNPQYLADQMHVSRQYVNNILSERHIPSVRNLQRIAGILEVPVASLFMDSKLLYEDCVCPACGRRMVPVNTDRGKTESSL